MLIKKDDIFKILITALMSLLIYIGNGVLSNQKEIQCRLRIVELNQARIMERMGVEPVFSDQVRARQLSKNLPP